MEEIPILENITTAKLILSANRALLCEIRPNMRKINVEYIQDKQKIILYFYYDSPPSQDELDDDVFGCITTEMSCDFSSSISWEEQVIVLPYPNNFPKTGKEQICVYRRYEPSPDEEN